MKRIFTLCIVLCTVLTGFAQTDTTVKPSDTIKVGSMIIIRKPGSNRDETSKDKHIIISNGNRHYKPSNISTNWVILDIGFANYNDKTNYASAVSSGFVSTDIGKDQMKLRAIKSVNVNIWLFMQKLNVINHVTNLKYGIGLEMYNWRYETNITYNKNPAYISRDTIQFSKNKLATDYITIPFMININPFPHKRQGLSFSVGISAGYLYNSRNKQVSDERGKQKLHGDFDLDPWRIAYVGEIGLGPVRVYGSYSINNLYQHGVVQYPYAVGLRFSNW